jgi:hypothetical protein
MNVYSLFLLWRSALPSNYNDYEREMRELVKVVNCVTININGCESMNSKKYEFQIACKVVDHKNHQRLFTCTEESTVLLLLMVQLSQITFHATHTPTALN